MKKTVLLIALAAIVTGITGCSGSDNINLPDNNAGNDQTITNATNMTTGNDLAAQDFINVIPEKPDLSNGEIDIDLTQLSSSMVYAQVYDMVNNGDNYLGKTVKVKGAFSYFQETDGREFFAVLISDATACCSQGIEFVLKGDYSYPDDYPSVGTDITVVGKFDYYKENYYTYCQLFDAEMEVDKSLSWN